MALEKIPKFDEVKEWAQDQGWITASEAPVQSVNSQTGDVEVEGVSEGIISMWAGDVENIPSGWVLCDGENGTPDLTDRFVVGAGSQYDVGDTGGEQQVQLTVDEMPSHNHTYEPYSDTFQSPASGAGDVADAFGSARNTSSTGGDSPHENRPPYYALAYIQKV